MDSMWSVGRQVGAICLATAGLAGCGGGAAADPLLASSLPIQPAAAEAGQIEASSTCAPFSSKFDETAACRRADGTLHTFDDKPGIEWRVRYFVRFSQMPCGEYPTLDESYVFHMVVNDLEADTDLKEGQRVKIRNAMFQGPVHCHKN